MNTPSPRDMLVVPIQWNFDGTPKGPYDDTWRARWVAHLLADPFALTQMVQLTVIREKLNLTVGFEKMWAERHMPICRPKPILFLGPSRCGKDKSAEMFSEFAPRYRYGRSLSWAGLPFMAALLYEVQSEVWANRHKYREFWRKSLDAMRAMDATILYRLLLLQADLIVGPRSRVEFDAAKEARLFGFSIWIERPGVEVDPTLELTRDDADIVIENDKGLDKLQSRIGALASMFA